MLTDFRTIGPFDLNWVTQQYKCRLSQSITFGLLACLQSINLFWLFFILKIAYNIVFNKQVQDVRSDDEDEEENVAETVNGGVERLETKGIEPAARINGFNKANGKATEGLGISATVRAEGKKQR